MILITGATGFLGSALVKHLQSLSIDVMPLQFGTDVVISNNYWQADLTRIDHLEQLAQEQQVPDTVIHLAGYIQIGLQPHPDDPTLPPIPGQQNVAMLYASNVGATANLVDYCAKVGVRHFIFASTQAVYGMPTGILTESSTCKPLEHYAASKVCAEQLLEIASRQGLMVTIARFPGLYAQDRWSGVVYNFCKNALQEKKITVTCNFPLPIDVIHRQDVVQALTAMTQLKNHSFLRLNIATGQPCSLDLLADSVADLVPGCQVKHAEIPQPVVTMDSSRAQKILDWKPWSREQRLQQILESIKHDRSISQYR